MPQDHLHKSVETLQEVHMIFHMILDMKGDCEGSMKCAQGGMGVHVKEA